MSTKIVSWNVNSIKSRLEHVKRFIGHAQPDVLMLQELKRLEFPVDDFKAMGYESGIVTQKAYNGVAILSKKPFRIIHEKLPGDDADEQARYLEVEQNNVRLINIYLPNGNPIGTEKFVYKLAWIKRLKEHLQKLRDDRVPFAVGGDFNVIPEDKDCQNPQAWVNDALFQPESRAAFRSLLYLGLTDAFRVFHTGGGYYTFWDYQAGAWERDNGIRIDHFLLSPEMADRLRSCEIDRGPRDWEKPSDHTPIVLEIAA